MASSPHLSHRKGVTNGASSYASPAAYTASSPYYYQQQQQQSAPSAPNLSSPAASSLQPLSPLPSPPHHPTSNTATFVVVSDTYQHNTAVACLVIPTLLNIYGSAELILLQIVAAMLLMLYGLDLVCVPSVFRMATWMMCGVVSLCNCSMDDQVGLLEALFNVCLVAWVKLQSKPSRSYEALLHGSLPLCVAGIGTFKLSRLMNEELYAALAPHVFSSTLLFSMCVMGSQMSSFKPVFGIKQTVARLHTGLLLVLPAILHVMFSGTRMVSKYSSMDDVYDLLLVSSVPYMVLGMVYFGLYADRPWPYLKPNPYLLGGAVLLASLSVQQRYLIPICHQFSYHYMGVLTPTWLLTVYGAVATLSAMASIVFATHKINGNPIFGEYNEDAVQLALALAGLCLGKSLGMAWSMTPLPILGLLGLSLWCVSRLLRYLAIFLFVVHATGVVVFTYRFVGIDQYLQLSLGPQLSLIRFGLAITCLSILIGLVVGLAARSNGGYLAKELRTFDLLGWCLVAYTVLLTILELALLRRVVPERELSGVDLPDDVTDEMMYGVEWTALTSSVLVALSIFLQKSRIMRGPSVSFVVSLAVGKAIAVFVDADRDDGAKSDPSGRRVLVQSLVAALVCWVMIAPHAFLTPVHMKSGPRHRKSFTGHSDIPPSAFRTVFIYCLVSIVVLAGTSDYVIRPFTNAIVGSYGDGSYYGAKASFSAVFGTAVCLWGLACLATINYYLPDGGGEALKKLAALAFIMGIGIVVSAPTLGGHMARETYNPYTSMSSLGSQLMLRSKTRTGGWGILAAALATLLAITGPLELKERRTVAGRKDKRLLLRTMIFSLLFGCGIAWFVTLQSMSESDLILLVPALTATMVVSFLGTIASVLGYFVEAENFDEVEQITKLWVLGLFLLTPIAGLAQLLTSSSQHPFGTGGWLSTYLMVAGLSAFAFSVSLGLRLDKDTRTRGLGNLGCFVSWICAEAVLYGSFGVSGADRAFLGIPFSVVGTLFVALILAGLEGEKSSTRRGSTRVAAPTSRRPTKSSVLSLSFPQLVKNNQWFPCFAGSVSAFIAASIYAIFLRGAVFFSFLAPSISRRHQDILASVVGRPESRDDIDFSKLMQSVSMAVSSRLDGSGIWTSNGFFTPLLHMAGILAIAPGFYLLIRQHWFSDDVPSAQVSLCLPIAATPIIVCRGIPSLQAAACCVAVAGFFQLCGRRKNEHDTRMRI